MNGNLSSIFRLLESLSRKDAVGTLVLGQKQRSFEVFVEESLLYLVGDAFLGRIDVVGLVEAQVLGRSLTAADLEEAALATDLSRTLLPETLHQRGSLDREVFERLVQRQLAEELMTRLAEHPNSFFFQEDHVPDAVIGGESLPLQYPLELEAFLETLASRIQYLERIAQFIPDPSEVFVLTDRGMARKQQAQNDFGLQRIFVLMDGFRDLRSILRDGDLYPFYVQQRIVEGLREGWIKKTLLPEVRNVDIGRLSTQDARRLVPVFKNAVKYGADELLARDGLARLMSRLDRKEEALNQYNFIGDRLVRMRKRAQALQAYFDALRLQPGHPLIVEKVARVYRDEAADRFQKGEFHRAVELYRNALEVDPDARETYEELLEVYEQTRDRRGIAELCDTATQRSRTVQDPALGVSVLRRALENDEKNSGYLKKLINLLQDFHRSREAVDCMERLARLYFDKGKTEQGSALVDKILRMDSSRKHLYDYSRSPPAPVRDASKTFWRRVAVRAVVIVVLGVLGYQLWTYRVLQPVRASRPFAEADHRWLHQNEEEKLLQSRLERRLITLSRRAGEFIDRHPLSLFRWEAEDLKKAYDAGAERLAAHRKEQKDRVVKEIEALLDEARIARAMVKFSLLKHCEDDDPWKKHAAIAIARKRAAVQNAQSLFHQAEAARAAGEISRAYDLFTNLVRNYPHSAFVQRVRFPVQLNTVPQGARARVGGAEPVTVPCVVDLAPGERQEVTLLLDGFEPRRVELQANVGPEQTFYLRQQPRWRLPDLELDARAPLVKGKHVYATARDGSVHRIDLETGNRKTLVKPQDLIAALAAPIDCGLYVLVALNNGAILRFAANGDGDDGVDVAPCRLPGLITSPITRLADSFHVAFTTSRGQLVTYDSMRHSIASSLSFEGDAVDLVPCGPGNVLVRTDQGALQRHDLRRKKVVWTTQITNRMQDGPVLIGGPEDGIVVTLEEGHHLRAISAGDGRSLWVDELGSDTRAAVLLKQSRQVLLVSRDDTVSLWSIGSRQARDFGALPTFDAGFRDAVELGDFLGILRHEGAIYLVERDTLRTLWVYTAPHGPIETARIQGRDLVLVERGGSLTHFELPQGLSRSSRR